MPLTPLLGTLVTLQDKQPESAHSSIPAQCQHCVVLYHNYCFSKELEFEIYSSHSPVEDKLRESSTDVVISEALLVELIVAYECH